MNLLSLLFATLPLAAPGETVSPQFHHALPNVEGKQLVSVVVDYPPGAKSKPHRHAPSAFLYAYVLAGSVRSQLEGEAAPKVYRTGEGWYENPGAHHLVSENASDTQPARLLAVFVVDANETLTIPDTH
ncbi:cupin domain-containing protein [Rudaea sp.]|uniref:cupin domain-containing protein n=1 Tax=Rudaea sp. TaxID=2136325 RepID=UPI00322037CD